MHRARLHGVRIFAALETAAKGFNDCSVSGAERHCSVAASSLNVTTGIITLLSVLQQSVQQLLAPLQLPVFKFTGTALRPAPDEPLARQRVLPSL